MVPEPQPYEPTLESIRRHPLPDWYQNAKLGIFVHWGLYSVPGWAATRQDPYHIIEEDRFKPMVAIVKELDVCFAFGYSLDEFAHTLHAIGEGRVNVEPLVTGRVGLDGVAAAFEDLAQPDRHAKILVEPGPTGD
jgi:threonine dehydrogenase-like Zn-dependent dehydrogenase